MKIGIENAGAPARGRGPTCFVGISLQFPLAHYELPRRPNLPRPFHSVLVARKRAGLFFDLLSFLPESDFVGVVEPDKLAFETGW